VSSRSESAITGLRRPGNERFTRNPARSQRCTVRIPERRFPPTGQNHVDIVGFRVHPNQGSSENWEKRPDRRGLSRSSRRRAILPNALLSISRSIWRDQYTTCNFPPIREDFQPRTNAFTSAFKDLERFHSTRLQRTWRALFSPGGLRSSQLEPGCRGRNSFSTEAGTRCPWLN